MALVSDDVCERECPVETRHRVAPTYDDHLLGDGRGDGGHARDQGHTANLDERLRTAEAARRTSR
jgi:hypothetical protein